MPATEQALAQDALELRIVSGRHQGAQMPAFAGMTLGAQEQADAIVSDLPTTEPLRQLQLQPMHGWRLSDIHTTDTTDTNRHASGHWNKLGHARQYGGIWISVAHPHQAWASIEDDSLHSINVTPDTELEPESFATSPALAPTLTDQISPLQESVPPIPTPTTDAMRADRVLTSSNHAKRASPLRIALLVIAIVLAIALGLYFNYFKINPAQAVTAGPTAEELMLSASAQIPALQLSIAQVDPALRLALTPLADGRIQVTGWVSSIDALDRLSTAMAKHKPAPQMLVRSISEMRADLQAMLPEHLKHLEFSAADSCCLRISGIVRDAESRDEALLQIQQFVPPDLELKNSLRLAESMTDDFTAALRADGFSHIETEWDGQQIVATVALTNAQRPQLEKALLHLMQRWPGLPFKVVTQASSTQYSPAPFEIRSVVGGAKPYLVLPSGNKLLPGASHAGWRLQAIEDHRIIFDQPRRINVAR